jgi:hypothetical protein
LPRYALIRMGVGWTTAHGNDGSSLERAIWVSNGRTAVNSVTVMVARV